MTWQEVRSEARLWTGDALAGLETLPDASVQCCVTSPPYYGLRAYLPEGHADKALEVGAEETPDAYVARLVAVFRDVRRVLRDDGTCWVNLGDSYASGGRTSREPDAKDSKGGRENASYCPIDPAWCKPKDLIGIPWMVAFALRADGWYLRQDLVWSKKNCMPESVTDRCTKSHEYVFLLTKRGRYFFDAVAIREEAVGQTHHDLTGGRYAPPGQQKYTGSRENEDRDLNAMRNRRSVWHLATEPCAEAHFATMPTALADLCIRAGSQPGALVLDPFVGSGTTGLVALRHDRRFVGCELNPEYAAMAARRLRAVEIQLPLFGGG